MPGCRIFVGRNVITQEMYYKGQVILTYTVYYPQFSLGHNTRRNVHRNMHRNMQHGISHNMKNNLQHDIQYNMQHNMMHNIPNDMQQSMPDMLILDQLNAYYSTKAVMYINKNVRNLYQEAMVDYEYSVANQFPVRQYDIYVDFQVTYNRDCILSIYFDRYEYTGGAHGTTVRFSDSWNIGCSRPLTLMDLFPPDTNIREYYISAIIEQIRHEVQNEPMLYFEDYENLVNQYFRPSSFYLTGDGVVIYFQQYEIAPYASGIPEFLIPFGADGANLPLPGRCP